MSSDERESARQEVLVKEKELTRARDALAARRRPRHHAGVVSRGSQADFARFTAQMGWQIPWYTITDAFDADFGVDQCHGTNAFIRDEGQVFRTYFINEAATR